LSSLNHETKSFPPAYEVGRLDRGAPEGWISS